MFLSRQMNGFWYIIYEGDNGKRTKKTTKTKNEDEANLIFEKFKKEYLCKEINMTFEILSKKFFELKKFSYSNSNLINYKSTIKEFINYFKNKEIKKFTQDNLNRYFIYLCNKNKPSAVNIKMVRLKVLFDFAWTCGLIDKIFQVDKIKVREKEKEFITIREFNDIILYCKNIDLQNIMSVVFNTGLRISEAVNLTWDDVDFENHVLCVGRSFMTKTKKIREVPLNKFAFEIVLGRYYIKNNNFVFTYKNEKWHIPTLQENFKNLVTEILPNKKLSFHSLRHSYASNAIRAGDPVVKVAKILGHENLSSTMIYTHIPTKELSCDSISYQIEKENQRQKEKTKIIQLNNEKVG